MICLPHQLQTVASYAGANPVVTAVAVFLIVPGALILLVPRLRLNGLRGQAILLFVAAGASLYLALYLFVAQFGLTC